MDTMSAFLFLTVFIIGKSMKIDKLMMGKKKKGMYLYSLQGIGDNNKMRSCYSEI